MYKQEYVEIALGNCAGIKKNYAKVHQQYCNLKHSKNKSLAHKSHEIGFKNQRLKKNKF